MGTLFSKDNSENERLMIIIRSLEYRLSALETDEDSPQQPQKPVKQIPNPILQDIRKQNFTLSRCGPSKKTVNRPGLSVLEELQRAIKVRRTKISPDGSDKLYKRHIPIPNAIS